MHIFPLKKASFSFTRPRDTTPSVLPRFTRGNTYSVDSTNAMVRYYLALYIYPFCRTATSCLSIHRVEPVHNSYLSSSPTPAKCYLSSSPMPVKCLLAASGSKTTVATTTPSQWRSPYNSHVWPGKQNSFFFSYNRSPSWRCVFGQTEYYGR